MGLFLVEQLFELRWPLGRIFHSILYTILVVFSHIRIISSQAWCKFEVGVYRIQAYVFQK